MYLMRDEVVKNLKEFNKGYVTDEAFRQMYGTTDLSKQRATATLDYDYAQAVSDAYASSLQNQNYIAGSSLGQGYKQRLMEQNREDLMTAFDEYKQNYQSNLQSLNQQFEEVNQSIYDTYLQQEEAFGAEADTLLNYLDEGYNYLKWLETNKPEAFQSEMLRPFVDEQGMLKPYREILATDNDVTSSTYGQLTDEGKKALFSILNYGVGDTLTSYSNYLEDQGKTDLLTWLNTKRSDTGMTNKELFDQMFGIQDYKLGTDVGSENLNYKAAPIVHAWDENPNQYVEITTDNIVGNYVDKDGKKALESSSWSLGKAYTIDAFEQNKINITKGQAGVNNGKKVSVVENAAKAAREGTLENGTIIDVNYGGGEKFYVYRNGQFYEMRKRLMDKEFNKYIVDSNKLTDYTTSNKELTADELYKQKDDILKFTAGVSGGKRDYVLTEAVNRSKFGQLKDGTIINLNYGGSAYENAIYYLYKDGKFYKLQKTPDTAEREASLAKSHSFSTGHW